MPVRRLLLVVLAVISVNGTPMAEQEEPPCEQVRIAVVEAVQGRLGRPVHVDLEALTCRLVVEAPGRLTATPDPAGWIGRPVRFAIVMSAGRSRPAVRVGEATAIVHASGRHVRTRHALSAGRTLAADDLELADGPIASAPLRRLPALEEVVGARTVRSLAGGEPAVGGAVVVAPFVRAGDRVRAIVRADGMEATVVVVAKQSGRSAQIIRVVNPDSRHAIRARVVAAGEVEVVSGR